MIQLVWHSVLLVEAAPLFDILLTRILFGSLIVFYTTAWTPPSHTRDYASEAMYDFSAHATTFARIHVYTQLGGRNPHAAETIIANDAARSRQDKLASTPPIDRAS